MKQNQTFFCEIWPLQKYFCLICLFYTKFRTWEKQKQQTTGNRKQETENIVILLWLKLDFRHSSWIAHNIMVTTKPPINSV